MGRHNPRTVAIIPARLQSSRFPGKPLAPILGLPMIQHVYHRTAACALIDAVSVATCDGEIRDCVSGFGGSVIMTSTGHERACDRVAEAALGIDAEIVVMVQGDEPMVTPGMIETAVSPILEDPAIGCVNLVCRIATEPDYLDPNTIKVVMDQNWNALYFSREPVPTPRRTGFGPLAAFKQVCVIPFRRDALFEFSALDPTPLEIAESIDMLRLIEHGRQVRLVETVTVTQAVDTPADLARVESLMRTDPMSVKMCAEMAGSGRA